MSGTYFCSVKGTSFIDSPPQVSSNSSTRCARNMKESTLKGSMYLYSVAYYKVLIFSSHFKRLSRTRRLLIMSRLARNNQNALMQPCGEGRHEVRGGEAGGACGGVTRTSYLSTWRCG